MAQNLRPRRLQNGQSISANAIPSPSFSHGRAFSFFALDAEAIVRVVLAAAPAGVTVGGEKEQASPEGSPEQLKLTACENPFSGVTLKVNIAELLPLMVAEVGEAESENDGEGRLMVYAAVATGLLAYPGAIAIALMVSVLPTAIAALYCVEDALGVEAPIV